MQLKDGYEIDFLVTQSGRPPRLIEVKLSEDQVSPQFKKFEKYFPQAERWQLVRYLSRSYQSKDDIRVTSALKFLRDLVFRLEQEAIYLINLIRHLQPRILRKASHGFECRTLAI